MKINDKLLLKAGVLFLTIAHTIQTWEEAEREVREEFENQIGSTIINITSNKAFQKNIGTIDAYKTKKKYGKTKAQSNNSAKDFKILTEAVYTKDTIARKIYKMFSKEEITNVEDLIDALLKYACRIWITQEEKYVISDYIRENKTRAKHAFTDLGFEFVNIDSGIEVEASRFMASL